MRPQQFFALQEVQEIKERKQQPRRTRTRVAAIAEVSEGGPEIADVANAISTVPTQEGEDGLDIPACLDRRPGHEHYHAMLTAWRGATLPARERFVGFLREEGVLHRILPAPTCRDDTLPPQSNLEA